MRTTSKIPVWKHFLIGMPIFYVCFFSIFVFKYIAEEVLFLPRARVVCVEKFGQGSEARVEYTKRRRSLDMPTAVVCTTGDAHQTIHMNFFFTNAVLDTFGIILYYCFSFSMFIPGLYLMDRYLWGEEWWPKKRSTAQKKAVSDAASDKKNND